MVSALSQLAVTYTYTTTTTSSSPSSGVGTVLFLVYFVIVVALIAGIWKVFSKAGKPGWAAIIPVYNTWTLFEIGGKPGWWALLMLIPFVNFVALVMYILAVIEIAKRFGKNGAYGFFLLCLIPIGWLLLGFGDAQYSGAGDVAAAPAPAPAVPTTNPLPPATPQAEAPAPVAPEVSAPTDDQSQPPAAPVQ